MAVIERSAQVPYSANRMLALVNDIDAYPEFLHWCQGARIEKAEGMTVDAALDVGIAGISKSIRTRNTTAVDETGGHARIQIEMLEGPLKTLSGFWRFTDRSHAACDVVLHLEYEVPRSPVGLILRTLFDEIAHTQLNAFVARARDLYGDN